MTARAESQFEREGKETLNEQEQDRRGLSDRTGYRAGARGPRASPRGDGGTETAARFVGAVKVVTFGAAEYAWHPSGATSFADPGGPPNRSSVEGKKGQTALLPKASITVLTGKVAGGA